MLKRCAPNMSASNFFHTWCPGVNICWCNKKIFFACWRGVHQTCRRPTFFFRLWCPSVNMLVCNKKNIFFSYWRGAHQTCRRPTFFTLGVQVSTCWCVTKKYFFHIGEVCTKRAVVQLFPHLVSGCQHVLV